MVHDTSLFHIHYNKVRTKFKVEHSSEKSSVLPYISILKLLKRKLSDYLRLSSPLLLLLMLLLNLHCEKKIFATLYSFLKKIYIMILHKSSFLKVKKMSIKMKEIEI